MLALAVLVCCVGSALSQMCKNAGCLQEEGFTLIYVRDGDNVNITAFVKTPGDTWVGVGISEDMMMPETDSAVGARSADGTQYFLNDRYNVDRGLPRYDEQQDLTNKRVEINNGYTIISFTRPINSTDTMWDIDLDQCRYALWAYGGSVTNYGSDSAGATFTGHTQKGVFADQICLCSDDDETNSDESIRAVFEQCPVPIPCKNTGCLRDDATGFRLIYVRDGDNAVNITAYAKTPGDTWVGVGISNDKLMPATDSAIGARSADTTQYFLDDRYNVDRGMPRFDEQQDLTNKKVELINGYTVISFTRPINSTDTMWDIDLTEPRYALWAYGGPVTTYGDDTTSATFGGHTQKGPFDEQINLCDAATTPQESIDEVLDQCPPPATCQNSGCLRDADTEFTLIYIRDGDYVNITAYAKTPGDTWVGVGISDDKLMPATDSAIGARSADGEKYFINDRYNVDRGLPRYDDQQDITNKRVEIINGYTVISFTRPITSTDTMWDISLDQCRYALWAYGGPVTDYGSDSAGATFGGHTQKGPFDKQICLCPVDDDTNVEDRIKEILTQCPLPTDETPTDVTPTDAAGHITVSIIGMVVITLMSVFAVSF